MLEIVFSQSARGSLKCARHPFLWDGIFAFSLGLSFGSLSGSGTDGIRREALRRLCFSECSQPDYPGYLDRMVDAAAASLEEVLQRSADGESARLWYSDEPDEACGFIWLLSRLEALEDRRGPVSMVKLPRYEQREDGVLEEHIGWGGVRPEGWEKFLPLEEPASPGFIRAAASRWKELREENAPLRAVVNGRLVSVPEDFYDPFLRQELARTAEEFSEAHLIGNILGRFQLGIGDGLLACRIEAMIQAGELEPVTQAAKGEPLYRRTLRKKR